MYLKNSFADNFGQLPTLKAPFPISLRDLTIFSCKLGFNVRSHCHCFFSASKSALRLHTYLCSEELSVRIPQTDDNPTSAAQPRV